MPTHDKKCTKKETFKEINKAFSVFDYVLQRVHNGQHSRIYYKLHKEETIQHNKFRPDGYVNNLTQGEEVKLFYVKRLVDGLYNPATIKKSDFLHCQKSFLYAEALAEEYREELQAAFIKSGADLAVIKSADYCKLMNV